MSNSEMNHLAGWIISPLFPYVNQDIYTKQLTGMSSWWLLLTERDFVVSSGRVFRKYLG